MNKKLYLAAVLLLAGSMASAQTAKRTKADSTSILSLDHFKLQNTFNESGKKPSPAEFEFTIPDKKPKSWLVNAGLSYEIDQTATLTSKIVTEFHLNTMVDKEQENFSAGYAGQWLQKDGDWQSLVTFSGKYGRDWKDSTHSAEVTGNYTLFKSIGGFRLNAPGYLANDAFTYMLTPYVGFEYQQIIQSGNSTQTGAIFRGLYNLSGSFAINKDNHGNLLAPHKLIEATVDYTGRDAFGNGTGNGEKGTHLLQTGLSLYLVDAKSASVALGVIYNSGSNPMQGLKEQKFWQMSLNIQLM
ncbi:MAG TPA: hypothetical protein VIM55_12805 [Mucilaginibacter sp.]